MSHETGMTAWEDIGGGRQVATVARSTPPSISLRVANLTDLVPVTNEEFVTEVSPCLALVSGVGMTRDDQRAWFAAAFKALEGVPIALLRRGAAKAMRVADHPSKIVPAIIAEIDEDWRWRRRMQESSPQPERLPAPGDSQCTPAEAREIIERFGLGRKFGAAPHPARPVPVTNPMGTPGRAPTREDYIRLGVDPAVLDRLEAERVAARQDVAA